MIGVFLHLFLKMDDASTNESEEALLDAPLTAASWFAKDREFFTRLLAPYHRDKNASPLDSGKGVYGRVLQRSDTQSSIAGVLLLHPLAEKQLERSAANEVECSDA